MKRILFSILSLCLISASVCGQKTHQIEKQTLRGLKAIYVLVENVKPEVEKLGLTRDQIQTDAELRLRKAGIRVASEEEATKSNNIGTLYMNVHVVPLTRLKGVVLYNIDIELQQEAALLRDSSIISFSASTYSVPSHTGIIEEQGLRDIRNTINDSVDVFINDYLAMNTG